MGTITTATTVTKTIETLPKAGFLAYIIYQLHKLLAYWQIAWEKGHKKLAVYLYRACDKTPEKAPITTKTRHL